MAVLALCLAAGSAQALDLTLPGNGRMSREYTQEAGSYFLPIGPWRDGDIPTLEVEGRVSQQAWRIDSAAMSTLQIMRPLREQLVADGFDILLDCVARSCGGFDFRFSTRVMPAPDIFVDLFDFRFVSARAKRPGGPEYVSVLVSRSAGTGYVQIIHVTANGAPAATVSSSEGERPAPHPGVSAQTGAQASTGNGGAPTPDGAIGKLTAQGHLILRDLEFATGSSTLGDGPFASLTALAAFLRANPARRVVLVGHTDTVGGLAPNVTLSRQRAQSVMARLINGLGVPAAQLDAEGMGYLSPIASNQTDAGREANRRVEAVLLSME